MPPVVANAERQSGNSIIIHFLHHSYLRGKVFIFLFFMFACLLKFSLLENAAIVFFLGACNFLFIVYGIVFFQISFLKLLSIRFDSSIYGCSFASFLFIYLYL